MVILESNYGINECDSEEMNDSNESEEPEENMETQQTQEDDYLEWREIDDHEGEAIRQFLRTGCGCRWSCCSKFDRAHYQKMRDQCSELTHDELDLVLMGQIMATTVTNERNSSHFFHLGEKVYR